MSDNPDDSNPAPNTKNRKQIPQKNIDDFWAAYASKFPGKITAILPQSHHASQKAKHEPQGPVQSEPVKAGYERARRECYATVDKISKECRRVNRRYRDIHFDMEFDLKWRRQNCLETLLGPGREAPFDPKSVKRVGEIFEKPEFYIDGASPTDIKQGRDGDCWFLSGLSACVHRADWIKSVCVHMDPVVGVYGFVFYRDGDWTHTVIDDRLYLIAADWDESVYEKSAVNQLNGATNETEYKGIFQTGSKALYFAQCASENETWLPLIEKAYAKIHGDFRSIEGGYTGEAIEDLTGGVTTEMWTSDILYTDVFWKELLQVNQEFLFSSSTGWSDNFLGGSYMTDRKGLYSMHAYSIMEAREVEGLKLVKLRNPWGQSEWRGAWSDGSSEWTPEWMTRLNHKFGDDGVFWMSFEDLLRKFSHFDRTRLFNDADWRVSHQWVSVDVPWSAEYNTTKFEVDVKKADHCVFVLSQLDGRYFRDLEGQYDFQLQFRIENNADEGYIVRSNETYFMSRSCNVELDLEPGTYTVLMKILAVRYEDMKSPEHVLRESFLEKREKLLAVGLAYDLAHAKGVPYESQEERAAKLAKEKAEKAEVKRKAKKAKRDEKWLEWETNRRRYERDQRAKERQKMHKDKKTEMKKAQRELEKADKEKEKSKAEAPFLDAEKTGKPDASKATNDKEPKLIEAESKPAADEKAKTEDEKAVEPLAEPAKPTEAPATESKEPPLGMLAEAEAKVKELMEQAQAIMAQAKAAASSVNVVTTTSKSGGDSSTGSETFATPTTSGTVSKNSSEQGGDKPEAPAVSGSPASPAAPEVPVAPQPPVAPEFLVVPPQGEDGESASVSDVSDNASVISWATSIDTRLDGLDSDSESSSDEEIEVEDDDNRPIADDPWNAVCVVGLRVFSKSQIVIRVVKPKTTKESEDKAEEEPLDVDDISKAVSGDKSVTGQSEIAKPSIDGKRPPLEQRDSFAKIGTNARRVR